MGTLKQYGIPFEFIRLKCNMELKVNQYRNQIKELIDHGIGMDTNSVETAVFYPFHGLHIDFVKEDLRFGEYIRQLQNLADVYQMALVVRNVKTKEDKEWLTRLGVRYIEGKLYKALPAPVLFNKIKDAL